MKYIYILLPVFTLIAASSCNKKYEDPQPSAYVSQPVVASSSPTQNSQSTKEPKGIGEENCGSAFMSVNGEQIITTDFKNILFRYAEYNQKVRKLDLRTNFQDGYLTISITNWDYQNPPSEAIIPKTYNNSGTGVCREEDGNDLCDGMVAVYKKNNDVYMSVNNQQSGFVKITTIEGKKTTGNFNLQLVKPGTTDTLTVTGSFTDQCYSVVRQ